jgi:hypothetical protein
MLQNWHLRSRAHACAQTEIPFEDGQPMYTAIYFDPESGGYLRRDVSLPAWEKELAERTPYSYWKTTYQKNVTEEKPDIASKESALALLQRLTEEDEPRTEHARYILAVMLERKRQLTETAVKHTENGIMRFYENKKSGDVFIIRDPELRLDELEQVQDEVAMLLGFGGPAAEAAKAVGMSFAPGGKLQSTPAASAEGASASANPGASAD